MRTKETSGKIRKITLIMLAVAVAAFIFYKYKSNADKTDSDPTSAEISELDQDEIFDNPADSAAKKLDSLITSTTQAKALTEVQEELRGDAKSMAASAYTMMVAVYSEMERYTSDLSSSMVYEGDILDVKAGFLDVYRPQEIFPQENPERKDTDFFVNASQNADRPVKYSEAAEKIDLQSLAQFCDKKCEASEREFEYIVAVNLDDDPELDVWTINERKELIHRFDDITNELK